MRQEYASDDQKIPGRPNAEVIRHSSRQLCRGGSDCRAGGGGQITPTSHAGWIKFSIPDGRIHQPRGPGSLSIALPHDTMSLLPVIRRLHLFSDYLSEYAVPCISYKDDRTVIVDWDDAIVPLWQSGLECVLPIRNAIG